MNDSASSSVSFGASSTSANDQKVKRERVTLSKVLPTDRLSFDKQREILRAFAAEYAANGNNSVTTDKAGSLVSLSGSTISQSVAFFCDIGILARHDKGGFIPSSELADYNRSCQWDESEARANLRPVFEKTWFYRSLIPRLQLSPQPRSVCLSILSGESKAGPEHQEKLEHLIRYLELATIVSVSGGIVSLAQHQRVPGWIADKTPTQEVQLPTHVPKEFSEQEEHSLFLDKDKTRKFTINSPLFITNAEYDRICKWIKVALIVEDEGKEKS